MQPRQGADHEGLAHRFASAFLMPKELFLSEIGSHRRAISLGELFQLKPLFGTSVQAIAYRCRDLGVINGSTFKTLFEEFKRLGWRDPPYKEPIEIPKESTDRFRRLCFRALAEEAISESKAAELLGCRVRDLMDSVYLPPRIIERGASH